MSNNKLTVKDILDISPKTKIKLYKVVNKEDNHTVVEIKAEHFDTTLYPFSQK